VIWSMVGLIRLARAISISAEVKSVA